MGREYYYGTDHNKKGMKYLFSDWERIEKALKGKFIYLFLDHDGTLAPIAQTPDKAIMPKGTKDLLRQLSKTPNCKIAIISGRTLKDISKRIGLRNIVYVGNHGFEIKGPKIKFKSPISRKYRKILKELKAKLEKSLSPFKGVFVEDKGFCLAVHYRLADENNISAIASKFYVATFIDEFRNNIRVKSGKMVREIRPPILWDKGIAALWLLDQQSSAMKDKEMEVLPVYIGDDLTDEDAFQVLRNRGLTIFVGKLGETKAQFYLKDTDNVARFLKVVLKNLKAGVLWRKKK